MYLKNVARNNSAEKGEKGVQMNRLIRTVIASIVAPASFPLLLVIVGVTQYVFGQSEYKLYFTNATWIFILTLPITIILGLPAHFIARQRGVTAFSQYVIGGLILGVIAAFLFSFVFSFGYKLVTAIAWCAGIGALSAFVFWLITTDKDKRPSNQVITTH